MLALLGEEFNLFYTLILVALVAAAYFYLLRPPPPPKQIVVPIDKPKTPKVVVKPPEVIPEDTKGKIKILFGTQTGTAEDFSRTLAREAKKYHIYAQVVDMEVYDTAQLPNEPYVIIVSSTHGEGEPPDTAKSFYKHLGSELSPTHLEKVNYTVFGLGNKTYEQYNAVGRYMDARMEAAGAKKFFERGEGDDDCSLEEDFNKWKKRMWPALCKHLGLDSSADTTVDEKFVPRFKLVHCPPSSASKFSLRGGLKKVHRDGTPVYDIKNPFMAKVAVNRELHGGDSDRSCRHIEFEIGDNLKYEAGDHLGVYPENSTALVEQLATRLGADLNQVIALVPTESSLPANLIGSDAELKAAGDESLVGPCTLRQIFADAIDLTTPPRKTVLRGLAEYATDPKEKEELLHLSKDGEQDKYAQWIKADQRTVLEVLNHYPSVNPPLPVLLELLPRLAPRFYSISSSSNAYPGFVHITSVVVRFSTPTGREHAGVCSTWMADLQPGCHVPVFIRESSFKLPTTPAPVVMVGPGTGLAPFRGFLQEMKYRKQAKNENWESVLFFGCRHRKHDYIYEDELTGYASDETLTRLHVAFSREQGKKVYVQDKLEEEGTRQEMWHFINDKNGYFYVCGDARQMAKSVHHALVKIVQECGNMSEEQAVTYVDNLQKSGRYLQDVWF